MVGKDKVGATRELLLHTWIVTRKPSLIPGGTLQKLVSPSRTVRSTVRRQALGFSVQGNGHCPVLLTFSVTSWSTLLDLGSSWNCSSSTSYQFFSFNFLSPESGTCVGPWQRVPASLEGHLHCQHWRQWERNMDSSLSSSDLTEYFYKGKQGR